MKNNKGIALASLVITIIVMLTITGTIVYTSIDTLKLRKIDDLNNDIKLLSQKITSYHIENNNLPILGESIPIEQLEKIPSKNPNDDENKYYVINLDALGGISLKYGRQYKEYATDNTKDDVYIINEVSQTIYYLKGITIDGITKYQLEETYAEITLPTPTPTPSETTTPSTQTSATPKVSIASYTDDGVPIPVGFYYVGGTKENGVVISDNAADEYGAYIDNANYDSTIEYTDEEKLELAKQVTDVTKDLKGNQFVWVPVEKALSEESDTTTKGIYWLNGEQKVGQLWATKGGNYFGTKNTTYDANSGLREPAIVTGSSSGTGTKFDGNATNQEAILESDKYSTLLEQFQAEFDEMVQSVEKNKGFYVGRYETGWNISRSIVICKAGTPMTAATDLVSAGLQCSNLVDTDSRPNYARYEETTGTLSTWYGFYKEQKELYPDDSYNKTGVLSGMIWGSQWDAIMNYMSDVDNPTVEGAKYITNSSGMGWYSNNYEEGNPEHLTGKDILHTDGTVLNKVKNIYDLAGNNYEWTQEADSANYREMRGSYYYYNGATSSVSSRSYDNPYDTVNYYSSRLQLYIR